jgi:hypothetical protein
MINDPSRIAVFRGFDFMRRFWTAAVAGAVLVGMLPMCKADEPVCVPNGVRVLPQFGELMPPLQGTTGQFPPTIATRQNRYEPWQNYGVSNTGYFRPRVLMFPDGESFWVYDGKNYPWLTTHMRWVTPFFISL